jgi:hypothetical protein
MIGEKASVARLSLRVREEMTQDETLEELEENTKDAFVFMISVI